MTLRFSAKGYSPSEMLNECGFLAFYFIFFCYTDSDIYSSCKPHAFLHELDIEFVSYTMHTSIINPSMGEN